MLIIVYSAGHPKAAKRALVIMPEFITNVEEWMSSLLDRSRQTKVAANWSNKGALCRSAIYRTFC